MDERSGDRNVPAIKDRGQPVVACNFLKPVTLHIDEYGDGDVSAIVLAFPDTFIGQIGAEVPMKVIEIHRTHVEKLS